MAQKTKPRTVAEYQKQAKALIKSALSKGERPTQRKLAAIMGCSPGTLGKKGVTASFIRQHGYTADEQNADLQGRAAAADLSVDMMLRSDGVDNRSSEEIFEELTPQSGVGSPFDMWRKNCDKAAESENPLVVANAGRVLTAMKQSIRNSDQRVLTRDEIVEWVDEDGSERRTKGKSGAIRYDLTFKKRALRDDWGDGNERKNELLEELSNVATSGGADPWTALTKLENYAGKPSRYRAHVLFNELNLKPRDVAEMDTSGEPRVEFARSSTEREEEIMGGAYRAREKELFYDLHNSAAAILIRNEEERCAINTSLQKVEQNLISLKPGRAVLNTAGEEVATIHSGVKYKAWQHDNVKERIIRKYPHDSQSACALWGRLAAPSFASKGVALAGFDRDSYALKVPQTPPISVKILPSD